MQCLLSKFLLSFEDVQSGNERLSPDDIFILTIIFSRETWLAKIGWNETGDIETDSAVKELRQRY